MILNSYLIKDALREIKHSKIRFLTLVLLLALGVGCFLGFRCSAPLMEQWAEDFYQQSNFMDGSIASTLGFTSQHIQAISRLNGVDSLTSSHEYQGFLQDRVVNIHSYHVSDYEQEGDNSSVNQLQLVEGEFPQNENQCLVHPDWLTLTGASLGQVLPLLWDEEERLVEIVGTAHSPLYNSSKFGTATLGEGVVEGSCYILYSSINALPTTLYLTLEEGWTWEEMEISINALSQEMWEEQSQVPLLQAQEELALRQEQWEQVSLAVSQQLKENMARKDQWEEKIAKGWEVYQQESSFWSEEEQSRQRSILNQWEESFAQSLLDMDTQGKEGAEWLRLAEKSVEQGERTVFLLEEGAWSVSQRGDSLGVQLFYQDSQRLARLSFAFPLIFYGVSALLAGVSLSKMVERQRSTIATLGALGYYPYEIMGKYVLYATLSALFGGGLGVLVGLVLLPFLLYQVWSPSYLLGPFALYFFPDTTIPTLCFSVGLLSISAILGCHSLLTQSPANLFRPKAPPVGGKIFLEKVDILWYPLSFRDKITLRNVFRHPKRFWVSVCAIGSVTGVMVSALGLGEAVKEANLRQYEEIYRHDMILYLEENVTYQERLEVEAFLTEYQLPYTPLSIQNVEVGSGEGVFYTVELATVESGQVLAQSIYLRESKFKPYEMPETGVILPQKVAETLNVTLGDTLLLRGDLGEVTEISVMVTALSEQFHQATLYMSESYYQRFTNKVEDINQYWVDTSSFGEHSLINEGSSGQSLDHKLIGFDGLKEILHREEQREQFTSSIKTVNYTVIGICCFASVLIFVVLQHLNHSNLTQRQGEVATLKVLGFTDYELSAYIYRENIIITFYGVLLGMFLGQNFHYVLVRTVETSVTMYYRGLDIYRFLGGAGLTVLFAVIVNVMDYARMKAMPLTQDFHGEWE